MKQIENEMNVSVPLEVIKASEIEPKEVKWLWYPYIPFGKGTLLQGDPGDGKSKLMLSVAALLSKGVPLPFTEAEEASQSLAPKIGRPNDKEVRAKAFLIEMLKEGEMLSSDCEEKLEAAGFKKSTIKKAKE